MMSTLSYTHRHLMHVNRICFRRQNALRLFSGTHYDDSFIFNPNLITHLEGPSSRINDYWLKQLKRVERQVARDMISKLTPDNAVGFENGGSRLLQFTLEQKKEHPEKVIILRCGDFYEVYGVDAVMFVAYAGLNPMRGPKIVRAGCPVASIQATLDGLTNAGLSAAIYEEIEEPDAAPGPLSRRPKAKQRAFSAVVSPGATIYPYKLALKSEMDLDFSMNKPFIGIHGTASSGYSVCEIRLDERSVVRYSRLSEDAAKCLLASNGFAEPLYVQNANNLEKFLSNRTVGAIDVLRDYKEHDFHRIVLRKVCIANGISEHDMHNFRVRSHNALERPSYVYPGTALQIGLTANPNVPDLIKAILPGWHQAHSARFLRRWISMPPPAAVADDMQQLCKELQLGNVPIPASCKPFQVGKAIQLLHAGQCNANVFREIAQCAEGVYSMLTSDGVEVSGASKPMLARCLLSLTSYQTGVPAQQEILQSSAHAIMAAIRDVVADASQDDWASAAPEAPSSAWTQLRAAVSDRDMEVLQTFFLHNETLFRGHVRPSHPEVQDIYAKLNDAALLLVRALVADFSSVSTASSTAASCKMNLDFSVYDNILSTKVKPVTASAENGHSTYFHPTDRKGQALSRRYTTHAVEAALQEYRRLAAEAPRRVEAVLRGLSIELLRYQIAIVHISNWALILQAAYAHTAQAKRQGWCLPTLTAFVSNSDYNPADGSPARPASADQLSLVATDMSAWWMNRHDSQTIMNDIDLKGMQLLTAPNMSGKSTLMRSVLVTALLANCGLFVPCKDANVPRYTSFFLRATSYDIPAEGMSAFASEMDDMHVVLRDSTSQSLVLVDEIGRGTSSQDGASLAGALLEALAERGVTGIFSTHLHELLELPLDVPGLRLKRMGHEWVPNRSDVSKSGNAIQRGVDSRLRWTYRIEDGVCTDSMGMETARLYGLPQRVLDRAAALSEYFSSHLRTSDAKTVRVSQPVELCSNVASRTSPLIQGSPITTPPSLNDMSQNFYESYNEWSRESGFFDATEPLSTALPQPMPVMSSPAGMPLAAADAGVSADILQGLNELNKMTGFEPGTLGSLSDANMNSSAGLKDMEMFYSQHIQMLQSSSRLDDMLHDGGLFPEGGASSVHVLETLLPLIASLTEPACATAVIIEAAHEPPISLEGHSCVYILQISSVAGPNTFYVGETDALGDRLRRHRMVTFREAILRAAVLRTTNKSAARKLETRIIHTLKQNSYCIENDSDGSHTAFGSLNATRF